MLNSVLAQKRGVYFKVISECIKKICFNGRDSVTGGISSFNYDSRTVLLNNGYYMPILGVGTWSLSNEEATDIVYNALKYGIRLIDTVRYYQCEKGVGKGIRQAIVDGIVKREDIFVTGKIMPMQYSLARKEIQESLHDLNLEYVDLMLVHQPGLGDRDVYHALENFVELQKIKTLGISNYYTIEQIEEVLSYAQIMPSVIQNENHIYYQNHRLKEYIKRYNIVLTSWYPLGGRGYITDHLHNEMIVNMSNTYKKTPAQIILRWQLQSGNISAPGSSNLLHIRQNYDIFDFELSPEDIKLIDSIDRNERYESL